MDTASASAPTTEDRPLELGRDRVRIRVKKVRRGDAPGRVVEQRMVGEDGSSRVVRRRRRHRRRPRRLIRRVAVVAAGVAGLAVVWGLLALGPASRARADLLAGRQSLVEARDRLAAGDVNQAVLGFRIARQRFAQAAEATSSPPLRLLGVLPVLGRTPDAVRQMSEGGQLIAQAGVDISDELAHLPNGISSLAPSDGVFPVTRYPAVAAALSRSATQSLAGVRLISSAPSSLVLPAVANGRREALAQVTDLPDTFARASAVLRELPEFLGAGGTRRYFLAAQSPAEMRGTGGFMGAYAILTVDRGRFSVSPFRTIADLPNVPPDVVVAPNASYAQTYDRFGGAGFWRNVNMTPDFPSAAVAIERTYLKATGHRLDGVIGADPALLADLLKVTGPIPAPDMRTTLTAGNVVPFVTHTAYVRFGESDVRKPMLGAAASRIVDRFVGMPHPSSSALRALGDAVSGGHLLLYSGAPAVERVLLRVGAGGSLAPTSGDLLAFVQNNAGGNKIDYYERRTVSYDVRLEPGGLASGNARVELSNGAPSKGPAYVIGPYDGDFRAGESVSFAGLYCGHGCSVGAVTRDGRPEPQQGGIELGYPFALDDLSIPSGTTSVLDYPLQTRGAWRGSAASGTYRLTILTQPTVRPSRVSVSIAVPPGSRIAETSGGMRVSGGTATWSGTPGRALTLEVRFEQPNGLVHRVGRILGRPLFHL
jgi:hypothetical protein